MDYTGVYEDILNMEHRVKAVGYDNEPDFAALQEFLNECVEFRRHIIQRTRTLVARVRL